MIEWNPVGLRFSNTILQAILTLVRTPPPKGNRLLVLATTSQRSILDQLDASDAFSRQIAVPAVYSLEEMGVVLRKSGILDENDINQALYELQSSGQAGQMGLGVKTILETAEMANLSQDRAGWFTEQISAQIARTSAYR